MTRLTFAILLPAVVSAASPFYCPQVNETGFQPSCCTDIVGQVGVWCVTPHLVGGEPNWECSNGPPTNVAGCCQSIGHTNPDTDYSLHLCTSTSTPEDGE